MHHEDVGGKKNERMEFAGGADGLDEPLLEHDGYQSPRRAHVDDSDDDWKEKKRREEQAWTQNFSRLITLWAQWFSRPLPPPWLVLRNSASCKLLVLLS